MLQIQHRGITPSIRWELRGCPPLTRWPGRPELPLLYWALHEVTPATEAHDLEAVDDLLLEVALWLDKIWRHPPPLRSRAGSGDLLVISAALWAEIQLGRGAGDMLQVALHAQMLKMLFAPRGDVARPPEAVPVYLAPEARIVGGQLPLTVRPVGLHGRADHEQFLLLVAAVLSNRGGHLTDHRTRRAPPGSDLSRTGWASAHGDPAGALLGSIQREDGAAGQIILRPGPCVTAVNRLVQPHQPWDAETVGRALAAAWLIDTTLIDGPAPHRSYTVKTPVLVDHRQEPVWLVPLSVYHPLQFFTSAAPARRGTALLRPVPTD